MKRSHGMSGSRLYNIWTKMKQRCNNPKDNSYRWYGEKGIKVCEEWSNSFDCFMKWAIGNGYTDNLTIDRLDSNKDYDPSNCRWITSETNISRSSNGKKKNRPSKQIEYNGKSQSLKDWSKELGISYITLHKRIHTYNYPIEEAFTSTAYGRHRGERS